MLNRKLSIFAIGLVIVAALAAFFLQSRPACCAPSQTLSPAAYQAQFMDAPHLLIDVRTAEEFASGHIPGAVNIPVDALQRRLNEVPGDEPVVVYCRSGNRSAQASQILAQAGYSDIYDLGGINAWAAQGLPVE